jgi:alanine-glyoxylate transaminase/(R)-3-amino-2-methylpropionate-pyruvate transaminase
MFARTLFKNSKNLRSFSTQSEYDRIVHLRQKYMSPSLRTFEAYDVPLVLEKASMQYMWDIQGNKLIDLLGQNLTVSVGHCHPKVIKRASDQLHKLSHVTTMYYHKESSELAKEIIDKLPAHPSGEDWVIHFVATGSEAVDLAIQMARTYTGRSETIALNKAYHGLHGYAAAVTAIGKATQAAYSSMFTGIRHVDSNDLQALENYIKFGTGGQVACMLMEPLQGYGGIFPLNKGYMKDAFKMISAAGGVTISDEVQTGYGRCGESFWGFQMANNDTIPDMVTMAKGMGNGCGIIGAVACRRSIADAFAKKMFFNTYGANPVACAAARGVLQVIEEEKIIENCGKQGALFNKRLSALCKELPQVFKEVRGKGLFQGLEVAGKTPELSGKNAFDIHRQLLPLGVVLGRGSAAGNVFRVQPPMCIEEKDVNFVCDSLEEVGRKWAKQQGI